MKTRIVLVGCGYWGRHLFRVFRDRSDSRIVRVVDGAPLAVAFARERGVETTDVPDWTSADAAVIATPPASHARLAADALGAGLHVWVEKPLAMSSEEAARLVGGAARQGRTLFVDHTFAYHPAVQELARRVRAGELGTLRGYDSERVHLGGVQPEVDVLWDLAPHDLAILDEIARPRIARVLAVATHSVNGQPTRAHATLFCDDGLVAHLRFDWRAPVKVRRVVVSGDRGSAVFDDSEADEKLRLYDRGIVSPYEHRASYRLGEIRIPQIGTREALDVAAEEFLASIAEGRAPRTGGPEGLRSVQVLEAMARSAREERTVTL